MPRLLQTILLDGTSASLVQTPSHGSRPFSFAQTKNHHFDRSRPHEQRSGEIRFPPKTFLDTKPLSCHCLGVAVPLSAAAVRLPVPVLAVILRGCDFFSTP
jgi:hypothetical protein